MIKQIYLQSIEFYESLTISLILTILCIFGIGIYRTTIFLIIYYLIKAIIDVEVEHKILKAILFPIILYTLYLDYNYGQIFKYHDYGNFIYLIIIFAVIDYFFNKYINLIVERISHGHVFSYCKNCFYENIKLTKKCNICGYEEKEFNEVEQNINYNDCYDDSYFLNKKILRCKMKSKTLKHLKLSPDEKIKITIKVSYANGIYKDGIKALCDFIVITDTRIIMLQSLFNKRGWRWKENIYLNTVINTEKGTKNFSVSDCQIIKVYTNNHEYELFLWLTDKPNEIFANHFNDIKNTICNHT